MANNAAGRLHAILTKVKGCQPNIPAAQAWRAVLLESDPSRMLRRFGLMVGLVDTIEREVHKVPGVSPQKYLRWRRPLEELFLTCAFSPSINDFQVRLDQNMFDMIEICAELLAQNRPERELSHEQLEQLRTEFHAVREELSRSDIHQGLKDYIARQLDDIVDAIETYDLSGIAPLERSLQSVIGGAIADPQKSREVQATPAGERFWTTVGRAVMMLNLIHLAAQLPADVRHYLPPPAPASIEEVAPSPSLLNSPTTPKPDEQAPVEVANSRNGGTVS